MKSFRALPMKMSLAMSSRPETLEALLSLPMEQGNVQESLAILSGTIGEKMEIRRLPN